MPLEYKKVLCPIEFDETNFLPALNTATEAVRGTDGTLYVLTAFPEVVHEPAGTKLYSAVNQAQQDYARGKNGGARAKRTRRHQASASGGARRPG